MEQLQLVYRTIVCTMDYIQPMLIVIIVWNVILVRQLYSMLMVTDNVFPNLDVIQVLLFLLCLLDSKRLFLVMLVMVLKFLCWSIMIQVKLKLSSKLMESLMMLTGLLLLVILLMKLSNVLLIPTHPIPSLLPCILPELLMLLLLQLRLLMLITILRLRAIVLSSELILEREEQQELLM